MSGPIAARLRKQFEEEAQKKEQALLAREQALAARSLELDKTKATVDEQVAAKLRDERAKIVEAEQKNARAAIGLEFDDLKQQMVEKDKKLVEAEKAELALRNERRKLDERMRTLELDVTRRVDAERAKVREEAQRQAVEDHRLKLAERDKQIADMLKQIDELKRKGEQGSQQTQGEVAELELEAILRAAFPSDLIEPVAKGVHGGDVLQRVRGAGGAKYGTILWESKETKAWSDGWLAKVRDDQREAKAELAAIMTKVMPKEVRAFGQIGGVWVTNPACAMGLATALRAQLIEVAAAKQAAQGQQGKMKLVYEYLSGPGFKHRVEAIVESFTDMHADLEAEKRAMQRIWAKRAKQIERVVNNTVGMHGELAGIIGRAMPEIPSMELKALPKGSVEK